MAGTGGKRSGAGRKPGVPNKVTVEREAEIASSGLTPLEYFLKILRDPSRQHKERFAAAVAAAPYCHPKLSPVDQESSKDIAGEWTVVRLSDLIDVNPAGNGTETTGVDPKRLPPPSVGRLGEGH